MSIFFISGKRGRFEFRLAMYFLSILNDRYKFDRSMECVRYCKNARGGYARTIMNIFWKGVLWVLGIAFVGWGAYMFINKHNKETADSFFVIGGAFGESGDCASFGEGEVRAAQLAIEEANAAGGIDNKLIKLITEDTQCNARITVNAIQKLISINKVPIIIGPTWGDSFQGGYPVLRAAKVPAISPSTAIEALEYAKEPIDYAFSTWFPQMAEADRMTKYLSDQNLKKVAIIYDQDPFGVVMVDLFQKGVKKHGLTIVTTQQLPTGSEDFRTILVKIKVAKPDVIFARFLSGDTKVRFTKQARDLGIDAAIIGTADTQDPSLVKSFGSLLDGMLYTYPITSGAYDDFSRKYKEKYNIEPQGPSAANAYDAVRLAIEALRKAGENGEKLQSALLNIKIAGTVMREMSFGENHGIRGGDFEIKTIRGGNFIKVE